MLDTQFPLLLHSFVQDTPPELDGLWNIPHLWRTASEQNLLPVLAYENKRWKLFDDPNVCRQLDGLLYGTVATNLNRCVDFETLSASFTEHGIAHMPVKGYYLRKLYPTPELRTFGDIDLLIHPEDRQKVHNLMLSLGYTVKQDWEPTYSYIKDAEYYEIHTNLMDGNLDGRTDLQAYFDAAWAHAEPDDGLRFRPEDDFHFIYTVCHLAKHLYGGGAGLRMPQTRSEKEIAGYRDVLATIHESHDYIPPRPSVILQLHRDLYKYSDKSIGGSFKNSDNVIAEELPDGRKIVRFEPVSAWETPGAMESLCDAFQTAAQDAELDPLLLIPIFILDFLCIHPFNEGNGRMSRLLTLLLLYRSGYLVGKYISIEKLISDTKETYYEALQESSCNWHEGTNDYAPFVTYMLGILAAAYRDFESRIELLTTKGLSKPDRVREIIRNHLGKITKSEIMAKCPDISQITVQRALAELLKSGEIIKLSGGRYTAYVWNGE